MTGFLSVFVAVGLVALAAMLIFDPIRGSLDTVLAAMSGTPRFVAAPLPMRRIVRRVSRPVSMPSPLRAAA